MALIRFDRPVGCLLLLWPTLIALSLAAKGMPPLRETLIFALGVFLTRSAGCVVNDYADRWLDPHVERTRARPLAAGQLLAFEALGLFAALMLSAFALVLLTNRATVTWALLALLLMVFYPYAKRVFPLPQLVLGIAFGIGIPMAFSALQAPLSLIAGLLFATNLLWTLGYDTLYAMVDRDDDRRVGAHSSALLFGRYDLAALGILHATTVLLMSWLGFAATLSWPYAVAVGLFALGGSLLIWSARSRDRAACFRAFRRHHWLGLIWLLGVLASYLLPSVDSVRG